MATAFQVNAFQQNAFQEYGGLTDNTVTIGINGTQEGDTGSLRIVGPAIGGGAPGRKRHNPHYVIYVDGKQYVGTMEYLRSVLEALATTKAEEAIDKARLPKKKPRIVVQPGRKAATGETSPETEPMQVQQEIRTMYERKFEQVYNELESEEEILALLL